MTKPVAAWIALMIGFVAGDQVADPGSFAVAAAVGAGAVVAGVAAASRCRTLSPATVPERARRLAWSIGVGVGFGLINLGANWLIANHDPALRALLMRRFAALGALEAVVAAPLVEEVLVRLFVMSVMAWVVWRLTNRPALAFVLALIGSSVLFAALHLVRPFPGDPGLIGFYRASLLVKYTLGGLSMGWLFWRWGLPYAMVCHAVVNATHLGLQRYAF